MAKDQGTLEASPAETEPSLSASAFRMRKHRERRWRNLRCVMVELREREIDTLIRRAGLPPEDRADHAAIRRALYGFFDNHLR